MNKKLLKLLTISGMFFLVASVSACGGKKEPVDPGTDPGGEGGGGGDPVNPPTPQGTKVEISFWHTFGQTIVDNLELQIDQFEKAIKKNENVDITVNLVSNSNYATIHENISKGLNTGNIPNLAVAYPDHVADYLLAEGDTPGKYVVDIDDYILNKEYGLGTEEYLGDVKGDSLEDFVPAYLDGTNKFTREGRFTFPYMKSTESMMYNYPEVVKVLAHYKPEFKGAKNKIVEYMNNLDWNEFMNLCRETLKYKDEINPTTFQYPAFYDSDGNLIISQMFQAGVGYSSIREKDGHKAGYIEFAEGENRTKAEKIVKDLRDWYQEGLFVTKGLFSTYSSTTFKNKECIFTIGSTGGSGYAITNDFEIGVCKVPSLVGDNPTYVNQGAELCIMRNPKLSDTANELQSLYAWKLLKFLTNTETNTDICLLGSEGYLPVRYSCYETTLFLDHLNSGETQAEISKCVIDEIAGRYYNTDVFPGSAELRTQTGGILTLSLAAKSEDEISGIFDTGINNAIGKMV